MRAGKTPQIYDLHTGHISGTYTTAAIFVLVVTGMQK